MRQANSLGLVVGRGGMALLVSLASRGPLATIQVYGVFPVRMRLLELSGLPGFGDAAEKLSGAASAALFVWSRDLGALIVCRVLVEGVGLVVAPFYTEWWQG